MPVCSSPAAEEAIISTSSSLNLPKPIRFLAESRAQINLAIDFFILQRRDARLARLATNGREQQYDVADQRSQPDGVSYSGWQMDQPQNDLRGFVEAGHKSCAFFLR